jgi:hypothetical protein
LWEFDNNAHDLDGNVHNRIVVVVVPLLSIMKEHCGRLASLDFGIYRALRTFAKTRVRMQISYFQFVYVYGYARPEDLVGNQK